MDFNALSKVGAAETKVADSTKRTRVAVTTKRTRVADSAINKRKKEILDSIKKRRAERSKLIADSKKFNVFKISDGYKNLKKRIKDALEETETTEAAIEVAIAEITPDAPAEQVVASVIEILGSVIDELQAEEISEEVEDEEIEDIVE